MEGALPANSPEEVQVGRPPDHQQTDGEPWPRPAHSVIALAEAPMCGGNQIPPYHS